MKFKKYITLVFSLSSLVLLTACGDDSSSASNSGEESSALNIDKMTLREKVGQMFFVRPEALDTSIHWEAYADLPDFKLQQVNKTMTAVNKDYPIGGMILYAHNIVDEKQLAAFIKEIRRLNGSPLLAIDEEGGRVARIANNENFDVPKYESMEAIAKSGDPNEAYKAAFTIGSYVKEYGFDIDFAPVADVNTNPDNVIIGPRAFSDDPETAADFVVSYLNGLDSAKVIGTLKHFPGHGDVKTDTHFGYASTEKTWDEMLKCEMIPFKAGIKAGAQMIMTAHISAPKVSGEDVPATLSSVILQDKLRGELGFDGVIVTDAMDMGAITTQFSNTEAAIKAIQAGVDIVLCSREFVKVFDAVVEAVEKGKIKESRIDESVKRILELKDFKTK
ncbi:beta-N-acetylhexosaminidase [Fibrobacter sp. UWB15]|jgi:beta-N-acetylhexosaminidase|uniref:glycoside hydrolase family 3 protein n=1 Tax=unclassified Fibrobacter TaxID=2634177 RepID=UPI000914F534|nr:MULTISPECIES: glycoside hydrolase family 3 protein [unclassified Fibrobacter]PWJ62832.1 beta-N-acetylhexosaminidase [Fibrobacter sp. UWB6]SHG44942.1 beta-N-acetylhexosaminidase [Fibrobacter sp. UWB8]SMG39660.1 beta-N-acetylhexosaminidase [Fibrobacter sp. UWB15]